MWARLWVFDYREFDLILLIVLVAVLLLRWVCWFAGVLRCFDCVAGWLFVIGCVWGYCWLLMACLLPWLGLFVLLLGLLCV